MKLSRKLMTLIVLASLVPLLIVGSLSLITTQRLFESQYNENLKSTSNRQMKDLNNLIERNSTQLNILANRVQLRLLVEQYEKERSVINSSAINDNLLSSKKAETSFHTISVTDTRGTVIGSTASSDIGKDYSANESFTVGKIRAVSDAVSVREGMPVQVLASPLILRDKVIGVVIAEVPLTLYSIITREYTDLGQTGESYIAKDKGSNEYVYITPLRFTEMPVFSQLKYAPDVPLDYRQQEVLKMQSELINGWTHITKIDKDEVDLPALQLRYVLRFSVGLIILSVIILAFIIARRITRPIERFTDTVEQIKQGDYSRRVDLKSDDEIGILAAAFNEMTDSMLASQNRLEASIKSLTQGFLTVDDTGKVNLVNESARKLLKLDNKTQIEGKSISTVLSEIGGLDTVDALKRCSRGEYVEIPDLLLAGATLRIFFSPVYQGEAVNSAVVLIIDETEERILQRSRDEFFSIASHELRTPLTAIRGNAALMQQFYPVIQKDSSLKEVVSDIYDSSTRLISIVNDFLDVSRIEQDKIKFDIVSLDIYDVTQSVINEMAPVAAEKGSKLKIDARLKQAPKVLGDHDRVKQIIYNLLGNALKFTESGTVTVSADATKQFLKITVTDTGSGMNEESQKLLFHKFQQATDNILTRDSSRGTGLGLYISKILVDKMGGEIQLESSVPGKGSSFSFTLPLATNKQKKD